MTYSMLQYLEEGKSPSFVQQVYAMRGLRPMELKKAEEVPILMAETIIALVKKLNIPS